MDLTAVKLGKKIKEKQISVAEAVSDCLEQIREKDGDINAFITKAEESAVLKRAGEVQKLIDDGTLAGPLAGVPFAVKDNICTNGMLTTCGSKILSNFIPTYSATAVERLEEAGAVIVGKANMDEFAMGSTTETSYFGVTKNPWDTERVPGGSSGGSAAAVASHQVPFALGSDTGGSIRQPASFCGVTGIKPTYGSISRFGLTAYASSLDQIGPIARDVTDCANILNVIAGHDDMDSTSSAAAVPDYTKSLVENVKGLKIGLPKEYFIDGIDEDVEKAIRTAIDDLKNMGAEVVDISLPHTPYAISTYYLIAPAEAATNLERYDGVSYGERVSGIDVVEMMKNTRTQKFGTEVKRRIMIGNYALSAGYYDAYYLKALKVRTLIQKDYTEAFKTVDVIACPTAPTPAYKIGAMINDPLKMYLQDICTVPINLAGLPGISLPCGFSEKGMPIGLQIIGKPLDEETVIRAAFSYESTHSFAGKIANMGGKDA